MSLQTTATGFDDAHPGCWQPPAAVASVMVAVVQRPLRGGAHYAASVDDTAKSPRHCWCVGLDTASVCLASSGEKISSRKQPQHITSKCLRSKSGCKTHPSSKPAHLGVVVQAAGLGAHRTESGHLEPVLKLLLDSKTGKAHSQTTIPHRHLPPGPPSPLEPGQVFKGKSLSGG